LTENPRVPSSILGGATITNQGVGLQRLTPFPFPERRIQDRQDALDMGRGGRKVMPPEQEEIIQ
jgi:hypothetical protein